MLLALPKGDFHREAEDIQIDGWKYCAKNECNTMLIAPRWHEHPSSSANRPSAVAVTVNINAEFNLSSIWWPLTPWFNAFQGIISYSIIIGKSDLQSSSVYTVPPSSFSESLPCRSNRSLPRLPLPMHPKEIIPTFLMSNIYIRLCLRRALTHAPLRSY